MRINIPGIGIQDIDIEEIAGRSFRNPDYTPEYTPEELERGRNINQIPSFTKESVRGNPNVREIVDVPRLRTGIFENAIYPEDPGYEEALAQSKLSDFGGRRRGGMFGAGRNLVPGLIRKIKEAQEAKRTTGGKGLFGINPSTPTTPEEQQMAREMAAQVFGGSRRERPMRVGEPQQLFSGPLPVEDTIAEPPPTAPTPTGSYESSYIDWLESKPENPTVRRLGRMPGGGLAYRIAQKKYREDLARWEASKPSRDSFAAPTPAPSPVETLPVETEPTPSPPPPPPPPPPSFDGFVPRNILAPSFDPKDVSAQRQMVADARARMTPGANIQGGGYLTYDNPMLGNKQTQFGGYGQPMPTAPLMNYVGLSSPITYSTPAPNPDAQPGGPPPPQIIR